MKACSTVIACLAIVIGAAAFGRAVSIHFSGTGDSFVRDAAMAWFHRSPPPVAASTVEGAAARRFDAARIQNVSGLGENSHDLAAPTTLAGIGTLAHATR